MTSIRLRTCVSLILRHNFSWRMCGFAAAQWINISVSGAWTKHCYVVRKRKEWNRREKQRKERKGECEVGNVLGASTYNKPSQSRCFAPDVTVIWWARWSQMSKQWGRGALVRISQLSIPCSDSQESPKVNQTKINCVRIQHRYHWSLVRFLELKDDQQSTINNRSPTGFGWDSFHGQNFGNGMEWHGMRGSDVIYWIWLTIPLFWWCDHRVNWVSGRTRTTQCNFLKGRPGFEIGGGGFGHPDLSVSVLLIKLRAKVWTMILERLYSVDSSKHASSSQFASNVRRNPNFRGFVLNIN
jgi:hypothetical protein